MNEPFIHIIYAASSLIALILLLLFILRDIKHKVFPAYLHFFIGLLLVLYNDYLDDAGYVLTAKISVILILWMLFDHLISVRNNIKLTKIDYQIIQRRNLLYFLFLSGTLIIYFLIVQTAILSFDANKVLILIFSINPAINHLLVLFYKNKSDLPENAFVLPQVRTFIFSGEMIINDKEYILTNIENKSSIAKPDLLETTYFIAHLWNKEFAQSIVKKLNKQPEQTVRFQPIEKTSNGIRVKDEHNTEYLFGNYEYVKDLIKSHPNKNTSSHYLLQNQSLTGSFLFKKKMNTENIPLVQKFNHYGNVVLLTHEADNKEYKRLPFDKIYFAQNTSEQKETIEKLSQKAHTLLITSDKKLSNIASYDFFIDGKNDLDFVNNLFDKANSVFSKLNTALIFALVLNILIVFVSVLFFENILSGILTIFSFSVLFYFIQLFLSADFTKKQA